VKKEIIFKILISLFTAFLPPLFFVISLKAHYNYIGSIIFILISNSIFFFREQTGLKIKSLFNILLITIYSIFALLMLIYIICIPYTTYDAWLKLVRLSQNGGSISFLFVTGSMYFSTIFAGLIYKNNYLKPLSALFFIFMVLNMIVYQSLILFITTIGSLLLCVLSLTVFNKKINLNSLLTSGKIFFAVLIISGLFFGMNTNNSRWLKDFYLLPRIKNIFINMFPNIPFEIGEVKKGIGGFTIEDYVMGGKSVLTKRQIFKVRGTKGDKIYLRCEAYDFFTGYSWQKSQKFIDEGEGYNSFNYIQKDTDKLKITTLADYYFLMPHTLDTSAIKLEGQYLPELKYGSFDTGFLLKMPVIKGTNIIIKRDSVVINQHINKIKLGYYLQIPDLLKTNVRNQAKNLARGTASKKEILDKIDAYLKKNFVYSLDTKTPSGGYDFVEDFLFNQKKGYCEHFATAFAILTRLNGIPSRYVTGYFITIPVDDRDALCTGLNAHSWVEVYLEDKGWCTWESTPPMQNNANVYELKIDTKDSLTLEQIRAILDKKEGKNIFYPVKISSGYFIKRAVVFALCILFIFVIILVCLKSALFKNKNQKFILLVRKIIKKTRNLKIVHPSLVGYHEWALNLVNYVEIKKVYIDRMINIIERIFYGGFIPRKMDLFYMKLINRLINKSLK